LFPRDTNTLLRAYIVYVRPLVEHNSVVWSPSTLRDCDIDEIESVQHIFTKRLPGLHMCFIIQTDSNVFTSSLELRRLVDDLIWCYKIVFGHVDVDIGDCLYIRPVLRTRGHDYKVYKSHTIGIRSFFFSERVINAWNGLPSAVDFRTLRTIRNVNLSLYLKRY